MKQKLTAMKDWCKATQRKCGFGYDAALDRLSAVKDNVTPDAVVGWSGVGRYINVCHGHFSTDSEVYAVHQRVMTTLLATARAAQMDLYSRFPRSQLPELEDISSAVVRSTAKDQEAIFRSDEALYFRLTDVVNAILKTCHESPDKDRSALKKYADTAAMFLLRNNRAVELVNGTCESASELFKKFTTTHQVHLVKCARSTAFINLMNKCGVYFDHQ